MKVFVAVLLCFLSVGNLEAVEKKDLIGKWIGVKGNYRWQIERFEDGTYQMKFRSSNVVDDAIKIDGKWEVKGNAYRYNWLKSDQADFEPDEEMQQERVHSFTGSVLVTTDTPDNREPDADYFNMEIKVDKFPDFDLVNQQ